MTLVDVNVVNVDLCFCLEIQSPTLNEQVVGTLLCRTAVFKFVHKKLGFYWHKVTEVI